MGRYLNIESTGVLPEVPSGQVQPTDSGEKRPFHTNITRESNRLLTAALEETGLTKSAFMEAVCLYAPDLLDPNPGNPIVRTARVIVARRVGRLDRGRRKTEES